MHACRNKYIQRQLYTGTESGNDRGAESQCILVCEHVSLQVSSKQHIDQCRVVTACATDSSRTALWLACIRPRLLLCGAYGHACVRLSNEHVSLTVGSKQDIDECRAVTACMTYFFRPEFWLACMRPFLHASGTCEHECVVSACKWGL